MSNCLGHVRHWFTVYGNPGLRSPACLRCGTPNPRPLSADERAELVVYAEAYEVGSGHRLAGHLGRAVRELGAYRV